MANLPYIKNPNELKSNRNTVVLKNHQGRKEVWRKVFMNGSENHFYILTRR